MKKEISGISRCRKNADNKLDIGLIEALVSVLETL
jgi:hypothetical protein